MIFLPNDDQLEAQSKQIIEEVVEREGRCKLLGFRDVPTNNEIVGRLAKATQPRISQVFLQHKEGLSGALLLSLTHLTALQLCLCCLYARGIWVLPAPIIWPMDA